MGVRLAFPSLLARCGVLSLALIGYHLLLREFMLHHGLRLGAVSYKLAPLYAYWRPHFKGWLVLPVVVLGGYFGWLRRTRLATSLTAWGAAACFALWFVAITTSVAMLDGGPRSLIAPLERTDLEYYGAVDRVAGAGEFMRDYTDIAATLPMHAQVHPPGAVLFVWVASKLLGRGPWGAAAGIIGFSSLSVILVYLWAGRIGGPGVARRAAALYLLTPSAVLFTATSMDGPFAVFLIAAMWLFWESLEALAFSTNPLGERGTGDGAQRARGTLYGRSIILGLLAGLAAGLAALMTYSVMVAILFCGIALAVTCLIMPERRGPAILAGVAAWVGFLALHGALWLTAGYDPVEMFRVAVSNHISIMAGTRHESVVRYCHITVGNLVVFFIAAGLANTVIWWPTVFGTMRDWVRMLSSFVFRLSPLRNAASRASRRAPEAVPESPVSGPSPRAVERFAVTACLTLFLAAVAPVYPLEVERVWMFLVPLVAIPVAARLFEQERGTGKGNVSLAVALLLAVQTLLTEVLLSTYW